MITREEDIDAHALHRQGWTISAIARHLGRADRLDGTVPALGCAAGPAGLGGPGGADRIQRAGSCLPAPVLPVGAVDLDDPDTGCGDVAGHSSGGRPSSSGRPVGTSRGLAPGIDCGMYHAAGNRR